MKVSREILDENLRAAIGKLQERRTLYLSLEEKYNIPISITADICALRRDISEFSDFIAFAIYNEIHPKNINHYFTDDEIKIFSKQKYEVKQKLEEVVFQNMVRVAEDQWIGSISIRDLMRLKDEQLIRYNENTQRTLHRVIHGENRYYKIFLNKKSVAEIKEAFESGAYIPDDITLNVPVDEDQWNPKENTITFDPPRMMDILDGYHRYIAISKITQEDPNFDYPMEIRIVSFSEDKAQQFIYQKDQKTQMKKLTSNTMNKYNPANVVVDQLNSSPRSNLQGEIGRNKGSIDYATLSALIGSYYFAESARQYNRKEIVEATNDLMNKFNELTTEDTNWIGHEFTTRELQVIFFCFNQGHTDNQTIRRMIDETADINSTLFTFGARAKVKKPLIKKLTALL